MFKKSLIALALLGSTSAFGTTTVTNTTELTVATELFGTTTGILLTGSGVDLTVEIGNNVADTAQSTFTFTLSDGTFGATPTITPNYDGDGSTDVAEGNATITLTDGGFGESSAEFTVTVTEAFTGDEEFVVNVPSIIGVSGLGTAGAVIDLSLAVANVNLIADQFVTTVTVGDDGGTPAIDDDVIVKSDAAVSFAATGRTLTGVNVSDNTEFSGGDTAQDLFEDINIADSAAVDETGTALALGASDTFTITVTGDFADNAELCLVGDAVATCDGATNKATIVGDVATFTLAGNAAVTAGDGAADILYEVDGVASIPLEDSFDIAASVTFSDSSYASPTSLASTETSSLSLAGLTQMSDDARIAIITKPGGSDLTQVRVSNPGSTDATIYSTLNLADGNSYFGYLGDVPKGQTVVFDSDDFAAAANISTWSGRSNAILSVTTAALGDIVIVPLIRSENVLTNQASTLQHTP